MYISKNQHVGKNLKLLNVHYDDKMILNINQLDFASILVFKNCNEKILVNDQERMI